jgi:hypothetical protein
MTFTARAIAFSTVNYIAHFGRLEYAFQKIEFGDKLDGVEFLTHIGQQEQSAQTRGIYKVDEMKVSQLHAEWDRMMINFPNNGFGSLIFPVTITATDPELPKSTIRLIDCRILSVKLPIENSGKASLVEFGINCRQITYNGKSLNIRRNAPNTNANKSP